MAENRRGKENRVYFSRGQMVLLGGAFSLASVIIFFLGMFIGKNIEERKIAKKEEPLMKIPVKPDAMAADGAIAQKRDEITFNDTTAKAPATAVAEAEEKPPVNSVRAQASIPKVEKQVEKVAIEAAPKKTEAVASAAASDQSTSWRVQVNAYPDEGSAKLLVDRLKNKGYNAYVSETQNKGKTWYRANAGRFHSREEAEKVVDALRTKENLSKAFAAAK